MKKYISVLLISLLLCSCKSITHQDFQLETFQHPKLPALESMIDASNLQNVYSLGGFSGMASGTGTLFNNNRSYIQTSTLGGSGYNDLRIQDTLSLFDTFVKEHISTPYGQKKGYIVLKINYRNNIFRYSNIPTVLISGITLFTANILGFPFASKEEEMKLIVEILNKEKEVIGRYSTDVSDVEYMAMYWGYDGPVIDTSVQSINNNSMARKITLENLKKGLTQIEKQINSDIDNLLKKLK